MFKRLKCFDIVTAYNGHMAYEEVLKVHQDPAEGFDLVVLDLNMPISDGYTACHNIRKLYNRTIQCVQNSDSSMKSVSLKNFMPFLVAVTAHVNRDVE